AHGLAGDYTLDAIRCRRVATVFSMDHCVARSLPDGVGHKIVGPNHPAEVHQAEDYRQKDNDRETRLNQDASPLVLPSIWANSVHWMFSLITAPVSPQLRLHRSRMECRDRESASETFSPP